MLTWDENKRQSNLTKHGIDFADLEHIFDFYMHTEEDKRTPYVEKRFRSLCLFRGQVVVLIWAEQPQTDRIISCRYGLKHETRDYFKKAASHL